MWQLRDIILPLGQCLLNLTQWWLMRRGHHPQWWHDTIVARRIHKISRVFTWLMDTKLDKMMAYGIGPPCRKSHDSLITWLYVASWQRRYMSNFTSPVDTKHNRVVAYGMEHHSKNHITLSKMFFLFMNFFLPQTCTFNLYIGPL